MSSDQAAGVEYMQGVLRDASWGILTLVDGDRPYAVPMNHAFVDGNILLHASLEGKKLDCIRRNPNVAYVVASQEGAIADHGPSVKSCHPNCDSVLCLGRARIVEDLSERAAVLNAFRRFYQPGAADLPVQRVQGCVAIEITVDEMTARRERDRQVTRYARDLAGE